MAKYLDTRLLQHLALPVRITLLGEGDLEGDGALFVGAEDYMIEDCDDEDDGGEEDAEFQPGKVRRELVGGDDVHWGGRDARGGNFFLRVQPASSADLQCELH